MKNGIEFVYFDVGGVALLDFSGTDKWDELQADLGIKPNQRGVFKELFDEHKDRVCLDFDIDNLIPKLIDGLGLVVTSDYSLNEDIASRFEPNPSIFPIMEKVAVELKIGLLTNMFPGMMEEIKSRNLLPEIDYDVVVDSSQVQLQKPDMAIYKKAQEMCGCKGQEILFIDNMQENLGPAEKFGWQTFLYDHLNPEESSKVLNEYIFSD